jgi:hypothetical protein
MGQEIADWPAPPTWSPPRSEGLATMSASSPLPFIAITPCRVADTRGNGAPIQGGIFSNSEARDWTVGGVCGIVQAAQAISVNITVTGSPPTIPQGAFLLAWATGDPPPPGGITAIMTYGPTQTISNAAVIPLNGAGQMTINVSHSTHIIMDVNGYYAATSSGNVSNVFLGPSAGNSTMTGFVNTGLGYGAFNGDTTGSYNTAVGSYALFLNTTGSLNTAVGYEALSSSSGNDNTAIGAFALYLGAGANNIAIGKNAGSLLGTGSNNIYIGNQGSTAGEVGQIRIGTAGVQSGTVIVGIYGAGSVGGIPVIVNAGGRLGTTTSSRRFKEDIRDIGAESDGLMSLRPVAFRYKHEIDPSGLAQYGLIAEEVAEIYPELVVYDAEGRPETIRYQLLDPLLLSEIQKQRRSIDSQRAEIEDLKARLAKLETRLLVQPVR